MDSEQPAADRDESTGENSRFFILGWKNELIVLVPWMLDGDFFNLEGELIAFTTGSMHFSPSLPILLTNLPTFVLQKEEEHSRKGNLQFKRAVGWSQHMLYTINFLCFIKPFRDLFFCCEH